MLSVVVMAVMPFLGFGEYEPTTFHDVVATPGDFEGEMIQATAGIVIYKEVKEVSNSQDGKSRPVTVLLVAPHPLPASVGQEQVIGVLIANPPEGLKEGSVIAVRGEVIRKVLRCITYFIEASDVIRNGDVQMPKDIKAVLKEQECIGRRFGGKDLAMVAAIPAGAFVAQVVRGKTSPD